MKVLLVEPLKHPRVVDIPNELDELRKLVGGWLQAVYPWEDMVALVCDEDGKGKGYPLNRTLEDYDIIVGTFFLCGIEGDDFTDLSEDLVKKYMEKFYWPERFHLWGDGTVSVERVQI